MVKAFLSVGFVTLAHFMTALEIINVVCVASGLLLFRALCFVTLLTFRIGWPLGADLD